jgi:hypothetical protein
MIRFIAKTAVAVGAAGLLAIGMAAPASAADGGEASEQGGLLGAVVAAVDDILAALFGSDVINTDEIVGNGD